MKDMAHIDRDFLKSLCSQINAIDLEYRNQYSTSLDAMAEDIKRWRAGDIKRFNSYSEVIARAGVVIMILNKVKREMVSNLVPYVHMIDDKLVINNGAF
jgi:hypothetical protein